MLKNLSFSMLYTVVSSLIAGALAIALTIDHSSAATTASVTATVTVQNISVSVSDGTVAYGTLGTSATQDTTTNGLSDVQTATNNGNVTIDLNISGQDSANWTLGAAPGSDIYAHKFCTTTCNTSPTWTAMTVGQTTLASGITTSGTQLFDLQISTPTSTTFYTAQSVDITIQAVAP